MVTKACVLVRRLARSELFGEPLLGSPRSKTPTVAIVDGSRGPVRYADSQGYRIAWQEFGEGPEDLVLIWGNPNNIESLWEWPSLASWLRGLGQLGRVVHLDQRGTGLSDRVALSELPSLAERVEDCVAVLDAAGMDAATVLGESEGAACAVRLAVTRPERVERLVLVAPALRGLIPAELREAMLDLIEQNWGDPLLVELQFPSLVDDPRFAEWFGRHLRASSSPGEARAMLVLDERVDEVETLRRVDQPVLVVVHSEDPFTPVDEVQDWIGDLPNVTLAVVPGKDRTFGSGHGDEDALLAISTFLGVDPGAVSHRDRHSRAILFTDIVGSTSRAADIGDQAWRTLLDQHDLVMNRLVRDLGGDTVKSTGDGILTTLPSVSAAVMVAQRAHRAVTDLGLAIRAGVHVGEVDLRGSEVSGLEIHVASRIADLAAPGEVWISEEAALRLDRSAGLSPLGEFELKGVPGTVGLWRLR